MTALAHANEIRLARAQAKRDIKAGELSIPEALEMDCVQSMTLFALLQAQMSWGSAGTYRSEGIKAKRLLSVLGISQSRIVRDLTERQREALRESTLLTGRENA
jgi:hypothetical protein